MTEYNQVYKCEKCGSVVEVVHAGEAPDCCGQPMKLMVENSTDAAKEKHVPVLEKVADGWKVTVGSVAHPMEEKHYIEWIELLDAKSGKTRRKRLSPGDKPEATFRSAAVSPTARAYCNLHGLWKAGA